MRAQLLACQAESPYTLQKATLKAVSVCLFEKDLEPLSSPERPRKGDNVTATESVSSKAADTKQRLLDSAQELFVSQGFHGTSTREIASRAGLSPAAMYVHYPSKQEVLFQLIDYGHREALNALSTAAASSDDPKVALRAAVFAFTRWHATHPMLGRIAQYEFPYLEGEHREKVATIRSEIDRTVRTLLEDGARRGVFALADVRMSALAILALSIDLVRWFPSRTISDPDTIAREYAMIAGRMVGA
jgi:AcrR family transcriptional regulator